MQKQWTTQLQQKNVDNHSNKRSIGNQRKVVEETIALIAQDVLGHNKIKPTSGSVKLHGS